MSRLADMLARHYARIEPQWAPWWINPPRDLQLPASVATRSTWFSQQYAAFPAQQAAAAVFGDFPELPPQAGLAVLSLPKSKALLAMMTGCLSAGLSDDTRLWLVGENSAGARSARRVLEASFRRVQVIDKARHCILYEAQGRQAAASFDPEAYRTRMELELAFGNMEVHSWPGVFAHGRLDAGTALLLGVLPELATPGRVLDFACGNGVIAAACSRVFPGAAITACDRDALALRAARATLSANGIAAEVVASYGFESVSGRFDLVISNPPFHDSFATQPQLGARLLASAWNFLNPGGQLVVVANRHLPYRERLADNGGKVTELRSDSRYTVLQVRR